MLGMSSRNLKSITNAYITYELVKKFLKHQFLFPLYLYQIWLKPFHVGNQMGAYSAPPVADLFLFCYMYERDFMRYIAKQIRMTWVTLSVLLPDTVRF